MAKYKIGDKVRVKDHKVDVEPGWVSGMDSMLGKIATISKISDRGYYRIEEAAYWWCDEMFDGLAKSTGNKLIDLLMEKLGVEVDEKFFIVNSAFNPFYFNKQGKLLDNEFDEREGVVVEIIYGRKTIQKIPKQEIKEMTVEEIEKELNIPKGTLRVKGDQ